MRSSKQNHRLAFVKTLNFSIFCSASSTIIKKYLTMTIASEKSSVVSRKYEFHCYTSDYTSSTYLSGLSSTSEGLLVGIVTVFANAVACRRSTLSTQFIIFSFIQTIPLTNRNRLQLKQFTRTQMTEDINLNN